MSYVNGDLVVGSTDFDWNAKNANLSENVKDFSLDKIKFVASTNLKGNFSLKNELEESQRMSCTAGVLLELLEATEMRGFNQVKEVQTKGPRTIIMDDKTATPDVQASYLQRDAAELIARAIEEQDFVKRRNNLTDALMLIDQALGIYPNDAVGLMNKGTALDYLNRTPEAIVAYESAIRLDGTNSDIILKLGRLLFNNGQYEKSIDI
jgi:tetratricopeptide (TPR) repeat protein